MAKKDPLAPILESMGELVGEEASIISHWRSSLKKHDLFQRWLQHPVTKEVFGEFERMAGALTARLSTEEEMSELDRRAIFKVRPFLLFLLSLPLEHEASMEELQKTLERAQTSFQDYRSDPRR